MVINISPYNFIYNIETTQNKAIISLSGADMGLQTKS